MVEDRLTEKIIGCAFKVYNTLGAGFLESVYKKALLIELELNGLSALEEYSIKVFYRDCNVGSFYADILVQEKVIVELKAIDRLIKTHEIQLVNYLKATGIEIGLLINFGPTGIVIKRKYKNPVDHVHPVLLSTKEELQ